LRKGSSTNYQQAISPDLSVFGNRVPASRADHAARLMLDNMAALDSLSAEDQAMLRQLPAPHGPLFLWLESQHHEQGPQPWAVLREGLRGTENEAYALQVMAGFEYGSDTDPAETLIELRLLLNRMLVEQLKAEETLAIDAAKSDPSALAHYRNLQARRRAIESAS
jgi:DNA primase